MFDWIKKRMSKGIWYLLATLIASIVAGPEILISIELMGLIELFGASTFVLMYVSGLKLFFSNGFNKFKKFESLSIFFIPSLDTLQKMPTLAIHAIPERTANLCFFILLFSLMLYFLFNIIFRALI